NSGYTTTLGIYADNATAQAVLTATSSTGLGSLSSNTTNTNRPVMTFGFTAICASPRTEVVATIISAPDLALSESNITICEGETSTIVTIAEGAGDYDTFEWSPNTGVSGDAVNGWTFNPVETIVYTLTVSNTVSGCANSVDLTVNVNPLPFAISVVGQEDSCENNIVELTVSGNTLEGIAVFGNSTAATPSTTSWPNPFSAWFGGTKHQMLYRADEITAQGLVAGSSITAVSFDIAAFVAGKACTDFTIRIGHTS